MKRLFSLILFFAVFALINGPQVYSMDDVDSDVNIETTDSYVLSYITSDLTIQPICILSGGLELKLPTIEVAIYVETSENLWLCNYAEILTMEHTLLSRLTEYSPEANLLVQTMTNEGPLRLGIYEINVNRHFRMTYM